MSSKSKNELWPKPEAPWRQSLRRFFARPIVEIAVAVLVFISVALTLTELWLENELASGREPYIAGMGPLGRVHLNWTYLINNLVTGAFAIELTFRFLAARNKADYFAEFWLDILATLPLFVLLAGTNTFASARTLRLLRLLRLVRLIRLFGVMNRLSSHFPSILRRGAIDFLTITGLLLMAILFGTASMAIFEKQHIAAADANIGANVAGDEGFDMEDSFWFSVYTLFAGEPLPGPPKTFFGKLISVFLMFMGLTIFAIFAGTVSAFMVDRLRTEGRVVRMRDLNDHIVICGWTPKTEVILKEYRGSRATKTVPIVVITEIDASRMDPAVDRFPNVFVIHDDFTKMSALERASIVTARVCLVLADTTDGRSEQDADARTILAALTVEKMNPDVYTCAELFNRSYGTHLEMGHVNEFVISEEYGAYVIAQAGMHRGLINVLGELLTYRHGNEFYRSAIPDSWHGRTFNEMLTELKQTHNAILVAVHSAGREVNVNPENHVFSNGDEVVAICNGDFDLGQRG